MSRNPYKTIADLNGIILNDVSEGVTLEYKESSVFTNRDAANVLCKVVTAFANSIGGQFVVGIESQNGKPMRLDGGVLGNSKMDWIYTIVNGQTFPAVESVDVLELKDATGSYYVVHVRPSAQAPHQSNDKRYYKRRGTHSEPMEHYEIEDVRHRPKRGHAPVRIQFLMQNQLGYLSIKNEHGTDSVRNLKCRIEPNFKMDHKSAETLNTRGLRELRAQAEQNYWLDTVFAMLGRNPEAELKTRGKS